MAQDKNNAGSLASGVAGAVIGAAAAAAAIALSDEKNRKKAEKVLVGMQKEGNKIFKEITRIAMELKVKTVNTGKKALPKPKGKGKKSKKTSRK